VTEEQGYYSLPLEECLERLTECMGCEKVLKSFVQEHAPDDKAWQSGLMPLLCEYYSVIYRYVDILNDLILTPPSVDESTDEEVITVEPQKYALLMSYSKLMLVDEMELKYKHRVHLSIQ
jgi:hypothetical protein